MVVKFEEINLKFKKDRVEIHIQSQLLSEDTRYSQYCNNVFGYDVNRSKVTDSLRLGHCTWCDFVFIYYHDYVNS